MVNIMVKVDNQSFGDTESFHFMEKSFLFDKQCFITEKTTYRGQPCRLCAGFGQSQLRLIYCTQFYFAFLQEVVSTA